MPIAAPIPRSHRKRTGLKPGPVRSPQHRAWIRQQPCCVCGTKGTESNPIQCAHVRMGTGGGTGMKPGDQWTVPLCYHHHDQQHRWGEAMFWGFFKDQSGPTWAKSYARRSPDSRIREAADGS